MEKTKRCFKCERTLPLDQFYAHPKMADGRLNKCKDCAKRDTRQHRIDNPEHLSAYEQQRMQRPERRQQMREAQTRRRQSNGLKVKARAAVTNAVRDGRLVKGPCTRCGSTVKVEGHHHDYSLPLEVEWLCFKCHREQEHGQIVVRAA
jgi:DNA-directed RNA polymerase subunit RPC12/RpoP